LLLINTNYIVWGWSGYANPFALSYGVSMEALVVSQDVTSGIYNRSGPAGKFRSVKKKVFIAWVMDETQLLAFLLPEGFYTQCSGHPPYLLLGVHSQRKHGLAQLFFGKTSQEVGLVFNPIRTL
jgi:hypothetical protein